MFPMDHIPIFVREGSMVPMTVYKSYSDEVIDELVQWNFSLLRAYFFFGRAIPIEIMVLR